MNVEARNEIWLPNLVFENSIPEVKIQNDDFSSLTVKKEGNPEVQAYKIFPQATTNSQESEKYSGESNPLVFARNYELKLGCEFMLHFYPFDTQTCFLKVIFMKVHQLYINVTVETGDPDNPGTGE